MKKVELIFIVNGVDYHIKTTDTAFLRTARNKALTDTVNTARPMDEWEIHNTAGQRLDPSKNVSSNGLVDGSRLFLNLKVGAGG